MQIFLLFNSVVVASVISSVVVTSVVEVVVGLLVTTGAARFSSGSAWISLMLLDCKSSELMTSGNLQQLPK